MQQDPYFLPPGPELQSADARLQYPNPFQMQPNLSGWQNSFSGSNMTIPANFYNNGTALLQYNQQAPLLPPVSTAMYGTTSTCSWAHTVPSPMPWVPTPEVKVPDPIKRFSAPIPPDPCTSQTATSWELLHNLGEHKPVPYLHLKRKGDVDIVDAAPAKLCITEEKMAARFKEMHISNQYAVPLESTLEQVTNTPICVTESPITNLQQLEIMLKDSNAGESKSIILAPELKKLVEPEKILSTFLNQVERPSMALVVWEPPKTKLTAEDENKEKEIESASAVIENNNNVIAQQLNAVCQQYLSSPFPTTDLSEMVTDDSMDT